ncbi:putative fucosylgalactoside 3-alpha-galactosyltransferase [Medicago truncatula]|uniref:Putative fucosylgalactoside 3-alpha-galactosyltransferase n=1 Tax=Medicago truncatula TaxID=3880 RepID=A0A396GS67_MEDTR|nr:beta-arabinofuranosyltransferase RAY1 [Medicago truncatula]RHN41615.1 putative fucosylgalactoside 3-alpha-galactosyltransferase [Medicago truncatula]
MKAFHVELWSIWLSGFVLILLSLYATQRLPSINKDHTSIFKLNKNDVLDSRYLSITIFTAPKPFMDSTGTRQTLAVRSWLALSPHVTVVLFSQHPSVASFASSFDSGLVSVDNDIDFTFLGSPYFHSMIAKSRSFPSDIFVIVDPETVILSGFISTLNHVYKIDRDWLLVASPQNASAQNILQLQKIRKQNWQRNHCHNAERMIMAWNNKDTPLHNGVLPPFIYGKGTHNRWIIHEAISSEFRFVFDASWTITSFNLNNTTFGNSARLDVENRDWEYIGNSHLGEHYGSFFYSEAYYSNLPKLLTCENRYIMFDTKKNVVYPIGHQGRVKLLKEKLFPSRLKENAMHCIDPQKSMRIMLDCSLKDQKKISASLELPFSLESLLSITADRNKTVVLTVAGYSYKDMLMSWVCRLRKLSIENFIVSALDQETYQFSILQGIPVFKDPIAPSDISFDECHFGTKCFQRVTKVKSRIVLKILKLGYNVLLSDVDTYWFRNPIPFLNSFGHAVLVAQSDEYQEQGPINLPRRLNSGFYYAHSDNQTIAAIDKVVKHAETSGLSEQPSFYDILCGKGGSNRVSDNKCVEPETNVTVHFLDRNLFPNGAYQNLWQDKTVKATCLKKGCYIIHNNWISGRLKKLTRQVLSGLWEYDPSTRMCLQS